MSLEYGIEIECLIPTSRPGHYRHLGLELGPRLAEAIAEKGVPAFYAGYTHALDRHRWKVVTDGSLVPPAGYTGLEIVSPPMTEANFGDIEKVCQALQEAGAAVNRSCGLHVHVGARHLSVSALKKLAKLYSDHEEVIDGFLPTSRRQNNNRYCEGFKGRFDLTNLIRATSVHQIADAAHGGQKYSKLNFTAFWKYGTVEFRHHSGTVDAAKITKWVIFCCKLVETAQRTANEPWTVANTEQHPYWKKGKRTRTLFQLLTRPEGVTSEEARAELNVRSRPNIRWHLNKAGVTNTQAYGRRRRMEIFRLVNEAVDAGTTPATLATLLDKLGLSEEDRAFWVARAAQLETPSEGNSSAAEVR